VREQAGARLAWLRADLDRQYALYHLPDHARLLANLVRWARRGAPCLEVKGRGLIDCRLYSQENRRILHFVNLSGGSQWGEPIEEIEPLGPFEVAVPMEKARSCRLLVSGKNVPLRWDRGWARFQLPTLEEHEVAVIE
jgi:hypothetical protein